MTLPRGLHRAAYECYAALTPCPSHLPPAQPCKLGMSARVDRTTPRPMLKDELAATGPLFDPTVLTLQGIQRSAGWRARLAAIGSARYPWCDTAPLQDASQPPAATLLLTGAPGRDQPAQTVASPAAGGQLVAKRTREPDNASRQSDAARPTTPIASSTLVALDVRKLRADAASAAADSSTDPAPTRPPWRMTRCLVGHTGRVCALAIEPDNQWIASGAYDSTIRVWDVLAGKLKVALTGHTECVRGLAISERSPFLFSCAEDKRVLCWDLQHNCVVRDFFGHLSAVYAVACHPKLDLVVSAGRDATVRVWDLRTRKEAFTMTGHTEAAMCLAVQGSEPQVVSGGSDAMIFFWDLTSGGKALTRLTRHRMPVRALAAHPTENTLTSVAADKVRLWRMPTGEFMDNYSCRPALAAEADPMESSLHTPWCTAALSPRDVLFCGSENGHMRFYDYGTRTAFLSTRTRALPGSLPGEGGVLASVFDASGRRLFTGEGDKTVKMWAEAAAPTTS